MNDAGKVAFTPKGDYSSAVTYECLDTVVYNGNAYAALKTTTGNAPTDSDTDENWKLLARGGTSVPIATEEIAGVVIASSDVGVSDTGSMVLKTDFTTQESLAELTSGESRTTFFGKIAKAVSDLISHTRNTSNPHEVTKSQVGLGNVPNVETNNQTPTYTAASSLTALTSGEKLNVSFGKIAKAINTLISHVSTTATTSVLGHVKLTNSVSSTSTSTAAVPASVKKAYDLANKAVPTANISQSSAITETGMYVLDAVEKNASVEGTMAHDIAELNSNLGYFMGYSLDGGVRVTTIRYVEINNYFYYIELSSDELPSGYKLAEFPMILATFNSSVATYPILYADRVGDNTIRVVFGGTITGSLTIAVQYTIVPA